MKGIGACGYYRLPSDDAEEEEEEKEKADKSEEKENAEKNGVSKLRQSWIIKGNRPLNPSNAKITYIQSTRTQRSLKTI